MPRTNGPIGRKPYQVELWLAGGEHSEDFDRMPDRTLRISALTYRGARARAHRFCTLKGWKVQDTAVWRIASWKDA